MLKIKTLHFFHDFPFNKQDSFTFFKALFIIQLSSVRKTVQSSKLASSNAVRGADTHIERVETKRRCKRMAVTRYCTLQCSIDISLLRCRRQTTNLWPASNHNTKCIRNDTSTWCTWSIGVSSNCPDSINIKRNRTVYSI